MSNQQLAVRGDVFVKPKAVACNNGAGGFEGRTSELKRTLFLRKVKLKIRKVKLKDV